MDAERRWGRLTWPAARDHLAGAPIALLPVGSTEAHGPHLPLDTDVVIAEEMARRAVHRLEDRGVSSLLLPALAYGVTEFAAGFAGTLSIPSAVLESLIQAIAGAVSSAGARILCLVNAHLEPAHIQALHRAALAGSVGPFRVIFPDVTRRRWSQRLTEEFRSGACHAGRYESSLVMAIRPQGIDEASRRTLSPVPISLSDAIRKGQKSFREAGGDRAYFGWPAQATAAEGNETYDLLAGIVLDACVEALASPGTDINAMPSVDSTPCIS